MGMGLILAGLILLVNPVINVFDIIPDALGFLLIFCGLTKLSYFFDRAAQARRMFFYLFFVELAKIFSIVLILNTVDSGSTKVLLTFIFSLAEGAMFVPAVGWMFESFSLASLKFGGSSFSRVQIRKDGKRTELLPVCRNMIIAFYLFRCVATLLPELTELQMYDRIGNVSATARPLTEFKPLFYLCLSVAVVLFAVFYIVRVAKYFGNVEKDEVLQRNFDHAYQEALVIRKSYFLAVRMKTALALFVLSAFASFMLIIDGVDWLVGAVSAAFLLASVFAMRKDMPKEKIVIPFAVLRGCAAIASFVTQILYFKEYATEAIDFIEKAAAKYAVMSFLNATEAVFALASYVIFVVVFLNHVYSHLKECGVTTETAQYSKERRDREAYGVICRKMIAAAVFAGINFVSMALYRHIVATLDLYIVVHTILEIIFIAYTTYAIAQVNKQLYNREM